MFLFILFIKGTTFLAQLNSRQLTANHNDLNHTTLNAFFSFNNALNVSCVYSMKLWHCLLV